MKKKYFNCNLCLSCIVLLNSFLFWHKKCIKYQSLSEEKQSIINRCALLYGILNFLKFLIRLIYLQWNGQIEKKSWQIIHVVKTDWRLNLQLSILLPPPPKKKKFQFFYYILMWLICQLLLWINRLQRICCRKLYQYFRED